MLKKISQVGLITIALFGTIGVPSFAQNTSSQTAGMEATVSGSNNQVNQTINQTIINHPGVGSVNRNTPKVTTNNRGGVNPRRIENRDNRRHNRYNDDD
ncbi:hypothetical protein PCC8801_2295 [Rippkaea orientalis PCC 8801]|uniref:Uncharacterized protein n=1 Tax=Rippkaea orientalis (strain PCC 8801 / RF-1) TaxID=41431 RepID=B7K1B9_RIPO1|nr:hypothetical protein [Rippkaea orientalis]ACK66314.1 hypothetical protein PCC8801_2295 [Rippkaea orientalis PCC 8801]